MKIDTYISHGPHAGPRAWVGVDIGKLSHHFLPRSFQEGRQIARQRCLSGVRVLQDTAKAVREVVWESVILKDILGARYSAL